MQLLKVSELKPHPKNEYFFDEMSGQKYEEFKESIRTSGVIEPLIITQDMVIVSGHQRARACLEEGIEEVLCEVRHYGDKNGRCKEDWILKDLIETNVRQRGEIGGSELKAVHRVDELRRIYGIQHGGDRGNQYTGGKSGKCDKVTLGKNEPAEPVTAEQACAAAGIDYGMYRHFKALADLNPDWQEMLEAGNVSATVACRIIAKLPADKQTELFDSLPDDAKNRLTANEAKRYIAMLEQQQKEYEAEAKQQRAETDEISKAYEEKSQKVLEQEGVIKALRAKRDPEQIAAMNKLYEQNEREHRAVQNLQTEKRKLEMQAEMLQKKIEHLEGKCSEANQDVGDLMAEKDSMEDELNALRQQVQENCDTMSAKDREILELKRTVQDLRAIDAEREANPNFDTPYSMQPLLKYFSEASEQIHFYALSDALNVNSKDGDIHKAYSYIQAIENNLSTIKSKLKGIA